MVYLLTVGNEFFRVAIGKVLRFGNQADCIHPEAVNSLIQPPAHHAKNFVSKKRVIPVKIGLERRKNMQEILPCRFV